MARWTATIMLLAGTGALAHATPAAVEMDFPGAGWQEAAPEALGLDSSKVRTAVDYLERNAPRDGVGELVIVRYGRVVWKGGNADKVHGVWSMTKSFTSTVLGLLV